MSLILLHSQWDKIKQDVKVTFPGLKGKAKVEEEFFIVKRQTCDVFTLEDKDIGKWITDGNWVGNKYLLMYVFFM